MTGQTFNRRIHHNKDDTSHSSRTYNLRPLSPSDACCKVYVQTLFVPSLTITCTWKLLWRQTAKLFTDTKTRVGCSSERKNWRAAAWFSVKRERREHESWLPAAVHETGSATPNTASSDYNHIYQIVLPALRKTLKVKVVHLKS